MRRLARLAQATSVERERYVDLLRVVAIGLVVLGHWLIVTIGYDDGRPTGHSALAALPWAYPLTWLFQVMPVFFLVGGFANAASLRSRRARDGDTTAWLSDRGARLVRPTTTLLLVLLAAAMVARLLGGDPVEIRTVVWFATIPLWFLAAYLLVVVLTPPMYALHRRFGLAVPLFLVALVGLGDLGRLTGPAILATGNYLAGWLAIHQIGFAWHDARYPDTTRQPVTGRRLPTSPRAGAALLLGGLTVLILLTVPGPYPVVMLNVPGERLDNAAPPSLALLATAAGQLGLILLLQAPARRWLRRSRPWQAVIAANTVVLTVFLWHLSAAILLVGLLDAAGVLPTPAAGSPAWWGWRLPWLAGLSIVLAALVVIFGPVEVRAARHRSASGGGQARTPLSYAGFLAVTAGLLFNSTAPRDAPEPLGLPGAALALYLVGAAVLRWCADSPRSSRDR